jgi:DNA-binding response OmpR family regulator
MGAGDQPTVLVVEDEPPLVEIYARWLEDTYRVRTAGDGQEALDEFDESVDVILLDRLMPGLSGDEVLAEVRERGYSCKVAMVTAVEPDFDIITMGFDDYVVKPVDREELLAVVDRLLSRTSFATLEQRYYALVSKRATLQSAKSSEELSESEEYAELQADIDEVRERIDETLPEFGDGELVAMIRDIEANDSSEDV